MDKFGVGNLELMLKTLVTECAQATKGWDILAAPGVEITQLPMDDIGMVVWAAKQLGA